MNDDSTPMPAPLPSDRSHKGEPRFSLGQIVATPGALALLEEHSIPVERLLARHVCGDWGDVCAEDAKANEEALSFGGRLLSSYTLVPGRADTRVWVITEWDRSVTTVLMPSEY